MLRTRSDIERRSTAFFPILSDLTFEINVVVFFWGGAGGGGAGVNFPFNNSVILLTYFLQKPGDSR